MIVVMEDGRSLLPDDRKMNKANGDVRCRPMRANGDVNHECWSRIELK